jgi:hypothetical protein
VFTVLGVHVPASSNDEDPVIVWVMAAVDNLKDKLKEAEWLELAPWF